MANYTVSIVTDLSKPLRRYNLGGPLVRKNQQAHVFNVTVMDGSTPVPMSGITADFLRADDVTVPIEGTAAGNVATVILPAACYAMPGAASLTINCTIDGATTCIGYFMAKVARTSSDSTIDPGTVIPSVEDLINRINEVAETIPEDYTELVQEVDNKLDAPATPGTQGQVLTSDGNGGQTWENPTGGSSPFESGAGDGSAQTKSYSNGVQTACGLGATATGKNTTAFGDGSHAEGTGTIAGGDSCHAEGWNYFYRRITVSSATSSQRYVAYEDTVDTPLADGDASDAYLVIYMPDGTVTYKQITSINSSGKTIWFSSSIHALLTNAKAVVTYRGAALGSYTHAEGNSLATQVYSHAEGDNTKATMTAAHSEGIRTKAAGNGSHAEGYTTEARSNYSHAEGNGTVAASNNQHVQGKYNEIDTADTYAHVVGAGMSATNRKNIHTLDWSGNAWFAGSLSLGDVTITAAQLQALLALLN